MIMRVLQIIESSGQRVFFNFFKIKKVNARIAWPVPFWFGSLKIFS